MTIMVVGGCWVLCALGLVGIVCWDAWHYPYCWQCGKTSRTRRSPTGPVCDRHGPIRPRAQTRSAGGGRRVALYAIAFLLVAAPLASHARGSLHRTLVVIDPGHGGADDGASVAASGTRVREDEQVYDVAVRVRDIVRGAGGIAAMTVVDAREQHPQNGAAGSVLGDDGGERIAILRGHACPQLRAGSRCLAARLAVAQWALRQYRGQYDRVAWISVHFDSAGSDVTGAVMIVPSSGATPAADAVARAIAARPSRARTKDGASVDGVLRSGDHNHGIRRLYVLSGKNPIRERMLVELGNFQNPADRWRIRDPEVRQDYARRIARGLTAWVRSTRPTTPSRTVATR